MVFRFFNFTRINVDIGNRVTVIIRTRSSGIFVNIGVGNHVTVRIRNLVFTAFLLALAARNSKNHAENCENNKKLLHGNLLLKQIQFKKSTIF